MIYQEAVEPLAGGQVIASFGDGSPAMIASSHGKGKTLYAGSYLSLAYERTKNSQLESFFQGLLDWAGVERPVSASAGIEVRYLDGPEYTLYFALNGGGMELQAEVRLRLRSANPSIRDVVTNENRHVPARGGSHRVEEIAASARSLGSLDPRRRWMMSSKQFGESRCAWLVTIILLCVGSSHANA
jgi:hypothetical protein